MTPSIRRGIILTVAVPIMTLAQMLLASSLTIFTATPDFLLLLALLAAMLMDANSSALFGFISGTVYASISAPPEAGYGAIIVSWTITCFLVGWLESRIYQDNYILAPPTILIGTIVAGSLFFLFSPQIKPPHWIHALVLTAVYNSVLSVPVFLIFRKLMGKPASHTDLGIGGFS